MRNKILLLLAIISVCLSTNAQITIDFDNGNNANYVSSGYTSWNSFQVKTGGSASLSVDGVTIAISHGSGTQADLIKSNWVKNNVTGTSATDESKLINDGIFSGMEKDNYGGYGVTTAMVAIDVKITGLPVGTHSIQAYHNYLNGTDKILPTIGVAVNGVTKLTGIEQTQSVLNKSECAMSFVEFTIQNEGDAVTITYFSEPQNGKTYTTTYFYINSLEIGDIVNVNNQAQNPSPANLDYHVDADSGVELSWTAAEGATSHIVYFGENEETVTNASTGGTTRSVTSITKTGLSPLKRYYWRVDEVINGTTYKGEVWSFQPRRDAFPGAEGAGKYAVGGRGYNGNGKVYHVTKLTDDGTVGTLRYGVENATEPTTIVFDVSGVIPLNERLNCSNPYVTIAGQTAPGIGVLVRDQPFGANSDEGVTRFMRFRYGHGDDWNGTSANQNVGNAAGLSGNYAIMDHCLLGWGSDETFSSRGAKNITFQHSLIGESLNQNGHKNYYDEDPEVQHGYAATIAGEVGSFHHNLLAHNEGRNWSLGGGLDGANYYAGMKNIYNNVVYNWGGRATDGGTHNCHFVNNYYKKGPATTQNYILSADHEGAGKGTQEYYVKGNLRVSQDGKTITPDAEGTTYRYTLKSGVTISWDTFVDSPDGFSLMSYPFYHIDKDNIEDTQAAFKNVLSDVGCNFQQLDNNEKRLIQETRDGTYTKTGSRSKKKGLIDKESDSEGWGGLGMVEATRPDNWDSDGDGIPAWFETAMGWSDAAANNNADSDGDYWTDLEEYLNWVAVPHFIGENNGTVSGVSAGTIDLSTYFAGYTSPSFSAAIVGSNGANASVNGNTLTYDFASCTEKLVTINVTASEGGISLTRSFNFFIDASDVEEPEDPTVTPEGTAYTLSTETYKSSTNTTTWNFTPNDLTFTVTNSNNKGYSTGSENGVKYTAGVQYTIGIPTGIQVDYITFRGYDNYSGTDAYLKELNGTTYGATDYVFRQKDSEGKYTIEEHTIQLATPATGTLTFTPAGNQVVWVITLYTSKVDVNLPDEVVNTMEEVADGTETVTETGTITWGMSSGSTEDAKYAEAIKDGFNGNGNIKLSNISIGGPETIQSEAYTETTFKPTTTENSNTIDFTVTLKDGYRFKPTKVEFISSRFGTNEGQLITSYYNNGELSELGRFQPERNKDYSDVDASPYYTKGDYTIESDFVTGTFGVRFEISGVATNKSYGLCDIIITGTLEYESTTTKTVVTLDEMATVHDLAAADDVTVKMKRGLTAGAWNTFCVPFDLTKAQLQTALNGSEVEIVEYTSQEGSMLYFENTENIKAGTPYLIKPSTFSSTYSDDMTPITFSGVDIVEARNVKTNSGTVQNIVSPEGAGFSFVGTYVRYVLRTDGTEYGLNSSNKLIRPSSSNIMRGLRAFFRIAGGSNSNAKVVIGGELTSIDEIDATANRATGVYHVSGHYVREDWDNGKGLPRGLYIVNGRKMVRK